MKLKSVELIGFKSFAKRTKINFPSGITEIVGPNGSGKSNIIEAIRWALGEQSAKNLRSSRMTDVIFSGSQSHPALNRAKVTLDFDNHDHFINTNYDDLTISRTVYRDGTNNYYINNESCRLRDVQTLFMNTGIGDGSFSIISQGKVSQIFKSKPVDRRFIIETVAGIYKYRSQKEIAGKKLIKVNGNLDRLQDLNYELNRQLGSLNQERKSALNYLKQKKLANKLDTNRLFVRYNLLTQKRGKAFDHRQKVAVSLQQINKHLYQFKQRKLKLQKRLNKSVKDYDQLQNLILTNSHKLDTLSNRFNLNHQKINFWRDQIKHNNECVTKLNRSLDRLNVQIMKLSSVARQHSQRFNFLNDKIAQFNTPVSNKLDSKYHDQVEKIRSVYLDLLKQSVSIKGQISNYHQNRRNQLAHWDHLKHQWSKINKLSTHVHQHIKIIRRDLFNLKRKIKEINQRGNQLTSRYNDLTDHLRKRQNNYQIKSRQRQTLLIRLNGLKRMVLNHSNLNYGSRNLLNNADRFSGILGPVAKYIKVPTQYIKAVETTLRSQLQQIIVNDSQTAKQIIKFMTQRRLGRVTLLPFKQISKRWVDSTSLKYCQNCPGFIGVAANLVSIPREFSRVKDHLLGNVLIARDISSAINVSHTIHHRYRVVTLNGNVVNAGGAITGGHGRYQYHGLLSQKAKMNEYQHDVTKLNRTNLSDTTVIKHLNNKLSQVRQKLVTQRSLLNRDRQSLAIKSNLAKRLLSESSNYQKLSEERDQLVKTSAEEEAGTSLNDLKKSQLKINHRMSKVNLKLKHFQDQVNRKNKLNAHNVHQYQQVREALIRCEGQSKQDQLKKTALTDKIKQITHSVDKYHQVNERYKSLINQQSTYSKNDRQSRLIKSKITGLHGKKNDVQKFINTDRKQIKLVEVRASKAQNQLIKLQNTLNQDRLNIKEIGRKLNEVIETLLRKYQIDVTVKNVPKLNVSLYQISLTLLKVQKRLREIGPVNVNSISRYQKVNHRYQFLSKQVKDLVTSKHQLITTVNQMNSKIITRFKSTFDQVNRAFKETYSEIFRGGKAKLSLIDPKHLLTTGINIMAQPPGKRYRNMELLSGGERALTAIALLFAILKIKPAPFCILDEAESALDAINIDRFGDFMQKLKKKTQFIVITHRKTTMLYADHLYGVTMQNSGVSKIISVNLEKAKTGE